MKVSSLLIIYFISYAELFLLLEIWTNVSILRFFLFQRDLFCLDKHRLLQFDISLQRRKFPTQPSVHICKFIYLIRYRFHLSSFSFLNILCFATWFSQPSTIVQTSPSRFYPIISKAVPTCTGYFSTFPTALTLAQTNTLDFEYI